jgi:hypothetical protein
MGIFEWLPQSSVGLLVSETQTVYYGLLAGHAIGMGIVVGVVWMFAARVLGFANRMPFGVFERLFRLTWAGFALNAVTGVLLFCANANNLVQNTPFLLKISFIAAGGLSAWFLGRAVGLQSAQLERGGTATAGTKMLAILTVALWTSAIIAGRIIAYTVDYI